jgi:hypothetical protein
MEIITKAFVISHKTLTFSNIYTQSITMLFISNINELSRIKIF